MSARENRITDGMAQVDVGLDRTLRATKCLEWAEGALERAEGAARYSPGTLVTATYFGVTFDTSYGYCTPFCTDRHLMHWMDDAPRDRVTTCCDREELMGALFDACLTDAGNVSAAMEAN